MTNQGYMLRMIWQRLGRGKTMVWVCLNVVFMDIYLSPVRDFASMVGIKARPFFLPFLLSDIYYLSVFMLSVLYFYSDVPFWGRRQMYIMIRMGRRKWNAFNCMYILFGGFLIWFLAFVISVIVMGTQWGFGSDWGKIIGTFAMTDAGIQTQQLVDIPYGTLISYEPIHFMLLSWLLSGLVISVVGMFMYCVSLFMGKICSAIAGSVLVILPGIAEYLFGTPLNYVSPVSWMRIGIFQSGRIMRMPSERYMICILIGLLVAMIIICDWKIRRKDLCWREED